MPHRAAELHIHAPPSNLGWGLRFGWGIGSLGGTTLINGVTFLALFYLSNVIGMEPALAGSLLFGAKLFDIATDPLMGIISDRTDTRWGRRRPWLLMAALISSAAFVMLFSAPDLSRTGLIIYATLALLLYATGYTMFNIPYLAMPAEMTRDYHERSRLMSVRVVFASLGILAGGSLGPFLVTEFGDGRVGYMQMSWVLGAIIGVSMVAAFIGTRRAAQTTRSPTSLSPGTQWRLALGNRPFVALILSKLLHMTGVSISISSLLFLVVLVLERPTASLGLFGLASTAGTLLSMPAWLAVSRRLGKRNCYWIAVAVYLPVLLSWLVASPTEADTIFILRGFFLGIVTGGLTLTAQAMLPDTIEHDAARSGLRREATFTSVYSLMEKTAFALGPLIFGALLQLTGFTAGSTGPVDSATARMIVFSAAVLPALASLGSAALLSFYDLDRFLMPGSPQADA